MCWYDEQHPQRRAELIQCIKNTILAVDRMVLICENTHLPEELKRFQAHTADPHYDGLNEYYWVRDRPTFETLFKIANTYAVSGDIVIICNTDIFPEPEAVQLLKSMSDSACYALARWDIQQDGSTVLLDRWDTSDTWVFRAPILEIKGSDFYMGKAGCDNAINERIYQAGYTISNPSKTIQFNHLHLSGVLNYNSDHKVPKPYLLITPHELGESAKLHFN